MATAPVQRLEQVRLDDLVESHLNHRTRTWGDMKELADSVKAQGVLQPILVRPLTGIGSNKLEIVFGHRRARAAKEAGLATVPAVVRSLTDVEALEANVVENLQRADVHPLEEAEGYEQLLKQRERPMTVEDIAAKVGKSKAYVYGRLKLTALCAEARTAFYAGDLIASVALLVARIPDEKLQKEALQKLKDSPWDMTPMGLKEASGIIHAEFMLRLADAPWKRDDDSLVPSAGACSACPHRSGAQPELFADLNKKDGDVCTLPSCFADKKKAWVARCLAEAEASGQRVLTGAEAKKALGRFSGDSSSTHLRLGAECHEDPKGRTYKQLLGRKAPVAFALAEDGELHEVVDRKAASDLLRQAGHAFKAEPRASQDNSFDREKKTHALRRLRVRKAIALIVDAAEKKPLDEGWLVDAMLELSWHDTAVDVAKRRELLVGKGARPEVALFAHRKKLTPAQLRGLLVETIVTRGAYFSYSIGDSDPLKTAAKIYGVDLEKCAAEAKAETKDKEDAKKAKDNARSKLQGAPAAKGRPLLGEKGHTPGRKMEIVRWCADAQAKRPPLFVIEQTGLKTKAAIIAKWGEGATFEKDKPRPVDQRHAEDERCLDCGVPSDQPSPGCDGCDHGQSAKTPRAKSEPRPPGRATTKFPAGGSDLSEVCTKCGAPLGEHDGSRCPMKKEVARG